MCHTCPFPSEQPRHPAKRLKLHCINLWHLCQQPNGSEVDDSAVAICRSQYTGYGSADCTQPPANSNCPAESHYLSRDCTCELCPSMAAAFRPKLLCLRMLGHCPSGEGVTGKTTNGTPASPATSTESSSNSVGASWNLLLILVGLILAAAPVVAIFLFRRSRQQQSEPKDGAATQALTA